MNLTRFIFLLLLEVGSFGSDQWCSGLTSCSALRITHGKARGLHRVPRIKPELVMCKTRQCSTHCTSAFFGQGIIICVSEKLCDILTCWKKLFEPCHCPKLANHIKQLRWEAGCKWADLWIYWLTGGVGEFWEKIIHQMVEYDTQNLEN